MKNTLDIVKQLSEIDQKNLTQRLCKLVENIGELSKVILLYEDNFLVNPKHSDKYKILEESVNLMLGAMSIAYELGFNDNDMDEMMIDRCKQLNKAQKVCINTFPVPFEIHITVNIKHEDLQLFVDYCKVLNVKPIVLDLDLKEYDVMTSSVINSNTDQAVAEMKRLVHNIETAGFKVVREKIETVPWHPFVPLRIEDVIPTQYFECHLSIIVNQQERNKLFEYCKQHVTGVHFSKNVFKRLNDDDFVQMLTVRSSPSKFGTKELFEEAISKLKRLILNSNILRADSIIKETIEYAIYDSNLEHDSDWINNSGNIGKQL